MSEKSAAENVWTPDLLASPHAVPDKAARVRRMFNTIAPRYSLINSIFSAGCDTRWRRRAVQLSGAGPDDDVLDVACGTGDFARAFARARVRRVVGCDFAHQMLVRALDISHGRSPFCLALRGAKCQGRAGSAPMSEHNGRCTPTISWCEADALCLPFPDESFSIVSCAFGVRNFADLSAGLNEMHRVLRPSGRAVILEFTTPKDPLARRLYGVYAGQLMPVAATLISGDRSGAYHYLPNSVATFLSADQMREHLRQAGFSEISISPMTMGVVALYVAVKGTT